MGWAAERWELYGDAGGSGGRLLSNECCFCLLNTADADGGVMGLGGAAGGVLGVFGADS